MKADNKAPPPPQRQQLVSDDIAQPRLDMIRRYVAKPILPYLQQRLNQGGSLSNSGCGDTDGPPGDPQPARVPGSNMYIGNRYHAADVQNLKRLGVVAVLNCASGGISRLPVDRLEAAGIRYAFTNCRQDHYSYPILHDAATGGPSAHLVAAKELYAAVRGEGVVLRGVCRDGSRDGSGSDGSANEDNNGNNSNGSGNDDNGNNNDSNGNGNGNVLFFCVAGQNRSPALALAVLMLYGHSLDDMCQSLATTRPFVLENVGFQWQLVELEHMLHCDSHKSKKLRLTNGDTVYLHGTPPDSPLLMLPAQDTDNFSADQTSVDKNSLEYSSTTTSSQLQSSTTRNVRSHSLQDIRTVEIELLIPGLCTMEVDIPVEATIAAIKERLVNHANKYLLSFYASGGNGGNINDGAAPTTTRISKSWVVLAMFGYDSMYDFPLEVEAIDLNVQIQRMRSMFHLKVRRNYGGGGSDGGGGIGDPIIEWTEKCRFALVILAVQRTATKRQNIPACTSGLGGGMQSDDDEIVVEERPWTFVHEERLGAPATLLKNTPMQTNLRAWDFVTGQAFASELPIVFSFSNDGPRDKRSFMKISTSANELQQFHEPGEGGILGMGANAIVHRVKLKPTSAEGWAVGNDGTRHGKDIDDDEWTGRSAAEKVDLSTATTDETWDAAVKRQFGLTKMLAFLEHSSEAGTAKRLRFANALNSDGRILYFYGLGVGMSANSYNPQEYKWEVMLLARYEKQFSAYTLRRFMEDYTAVPNDHTKSHERNTKVEKFQESMSLISVKLLLVNLLNAFRDLTLMGVQAFDFNHLNNVLVSRDSQTVQLIDIDGGAKGSIQFSSEYIQGCTMTPTGGTKRLSAAYHKPSLDIDLNTVLPTVVEQLILGKGRGKSYTANRRSEIWRADAEKAKELIKETIFENFFPCNVKQIGNDQDDWARAEKVVSKVAEWFYATLKRQYPWDNWTNDVYDALRCIDHLPIA